MFQCYQKKLIHFACVSHQRIQGNFHLIRSCAQQVPSLSHIIVEGRDMMYKLVYDTEEEMALADALSHLLCIYTVWLREPQHNSNTSHRH